MARAKKLKPRLCPNGRLIAADQLVCGCIYCKIDRLRANPDGMVKAGEFIEIMDYVFNQIENVRSEIPVEYDPQWE